MLIEEDIQRAIDRNMLCYDADAPSGVLTRRLFALMICVAYQQDELVEKFYIPNIITDTTLSKELSQFFNVELELDYRLADFSYCKLAQGDQHIIIAKTDTGYLMGSF